MQVDRVISHFEKLDFLSLRGRLLIASAGHEVSSDFELVLLKDLPNTEESRPGAESRFLGFPGHTI